MSNVPVAAHLYHLDGEADPHLGRHIRSLRRHRWWIVGAAIIGALTLGVLSLGTEYQSRATMNVIREAPELEVVDLSIATLTGSISGPSLALQLGDAELERRAEEELDGELSVTVLDVSTPGSIALNITLLSDDEQRTNSGAAFYEQAFADIVTAATSESVAQTSDVLEARQASGEARAEQLTEQLSEPGLSDSLVEAFSRELSDLQTELREIGDQQQALDQLASRSPTAVAISGVDTVSGGVIPFIAGALLGALLGALVVLALSFLDWRVSGRDAIDPAVAGPVIGIIAATTPNHLDTLAVSLAHHSRGRTAVLAPVDDRDAAKMASMIAQGMVDRGLPRPEVIAPPQQGLEGSDEAANPTYVLVAVAQRSRRSDFTLAASTLHDAGADIAGTILAARTESAYRDAAA
jgi:hypothetical protein